MHCGYKGKVLLFGGEEMMFHAISNEHVLMIVYGTKALVFVKSEYILTSNHHQTLGPINFHNSIFIRGGMKQHVFTTKEEDPTSPYTVSSSWM